MILADNEIAPDGLRIRIPMGVFVPNTTAFLPCVNTREAIDQLTDVFKRHGRNIKCKIRIEDNILGVRFTVVT